ncbi:MAG: PorT family protein [bacterium]|nr:PorT family protein [bacterium]
MRKMIATGLVVVLSALLMGAPVWAGPSFGIKAGINIADLNDLETIESIDELEQEAKTGFVGGVHLKFPLGIFDLQLEGLYSMKGAKGQSIDGLSSRSWETKLTYFEVPLLLKYELPTPVLKPFVYGGASIAFLMSAEEKNERINSDWVEIDESLNSEDYGWVLGGGIRLIGISLEARYTQGITDTVEKSGDKLIDQAKNKTWSVMAGLDF